VVEILIYEKIRDSIRS